MFYNKLVNATLVLITVNCLIGCGSKTASSQVLADGTTSTTGTGTSTTTTSTGTGNTTLPSNLFDNSTATDTKPVTSTLTPGTAPTYANLCASSDSYIYGAGTSFGSLTPATGTTSTSNTAGGYCTGAQLDPNSLLSSGVQTMQDLFSCYQAVLQNRPAANDAASVSSAIQIGGMAISRCARMYMQAVQSYGAQNGGWSPYQNQVLQSNDALLYTVLRAFSNHH